jgi:hypothetical protein
MQMLKMKKKIKLHEIGRWLVLTGFISKTWAYTIMLVNEPKQKHCTLSITGEIPL